VFQQWDNGAQGFELVKRLAFSDLSDMSLDSYGFNRRLVFRKKDFSFESFDFTQASGNFVDAQKVEEAFKYLQARVKKPDSD